MALFAWLLPSHHADVLLSSVVVSLSAALCLVYALQRHLIYLPGVPAGSRTTVWRPDRFALATFREVTLTSSDNVRLHAFWIPSQGGAARARACPTVILFHANAGNMGHRLPIVSRLMQMVDVNVFLLSYRGYGESKGYPHEAGIKRDAQAALDYVIDELGTRTGEIDVARVILYGQSIGGAVAINCAADNHSRLAGLIVENTFLSLPKLIPSVMPILGWAAALCHQVWNSEARMAQLAADGHKVKMLLLSGDLDELIPPAHMRRLREIATRTGGHVTWRAFPKGTHNDTLLQPGYFDALASFIKSI